MCEGYYEAAYWRAVLIMERILKSITVSRVQTITLTCPCCLHLHGLSFYTTMKIPANEKTLPNCISFPFYIC